MPTQRTHSRPSLAERLWSGATTDENGCWIWQRARDRYGYGTIKRDGRNCCTHRIAYELIKGPIPAGLTIDHLCRVRACINPDHLEAVTNRENLMRGIGHAATNIRKTHCKRGHLFDDSNTYKNKGKRYCRICDRARARRRQR